MEIFRSSAKKQPQNLRKLSTQINLIRKMMGKPLGWRAPSCSTPCWSPSKGNTPDKYHYIRCIWGRLLRVPSQGAPTIFPMNLHCLWRFSYVPCGPRCLRRQLTTAQATRHHIVLRLGIEIVDLKNVRCCGWAFTHWVEGVGELR